MAISSLNDRILLHSAASNALAETNFYQAILSTLVDAGGYIVLTKNDITGKIGFTFDDSTVVSTSTTIDPGIGLSGGGSLASNVTFDFDMNEFPVGSTIDTANDYLVFRDTSTGQDQIATIDQITRGLTAGLPLGSI